MKWLIIVLILVLLYCLIIYFAFLYTFSRKIKVNMEKYMRDGYADVLQDRKKRVLNYPMEEVFIESQDHLKLYGRYFHLEGHDKLIVMCHGWKSEWYIDFSQLAIWFYEKCNCDLLIMDERGIGRSEGKYISFGLNEHLDIHDWVMWAHHKQNLPIYLYGTSMGAATVLMTSASLNDIVSGIIADSPFTQPYDELKDFAKRNIHLPEYPFLPSMNFLVKTFIKKDLKSIDAMEILKDTKMPIVIFHGGLDFFCNVKISQKIKEMNLPNVSVYIYPDSNHCCSYVKHEKEYENIISRLIEQ